jgi:hypothetical protein
MIVKITISPVGNLSYIQLITAVGAIWQPAQVPRVVIHTPNLNQVTSSSSPLT